MNLSQKEARLLSGKTGVDQRKAGMALVREVSRRFYLDMGVHPDLFDLSTKTPHSRIYVLDRGELARFGLETRSDSFETPWIMSDMPENKFVVTKTVTRRNASSPTEYLAFRFMLACTANGQAFVGYRRDLPQNPDQATTVVRATFDNGFIDFKPFNAGSGAETGASYPELYEDTIATMAAAKTLTLTEKKKTGAQEILETKLSNAGFAQALGEFRKRCVPGFLAPRYKLDSPPAPAVRRTT